MSGAIHPEGRAPELAAAVAKPRAARREVLVAAALGAVLMVVVQSATRDIAGNDGYYHVKMALMLPEVGYLTSFPWLHWTIFREQFVSHHYGFHTLLAPFVCLADRAAEDAALGGKIASVAAMGATFAAVSAVLRRLEAPHRFLWMLLLGAAPWHFWMRQAYVRAPMAALPLLVVGVLWCARGRTVAVGVLAFVFTHVYGGGVLFPLVPLAFLAAAAINGNALRVPVVQSLCAVVGIALAFVLNPYFPANIGFYTTQLFVTGLGAPGDVGSEWKPYVGWNLLGQAAVLGVVYVWCMIRRWQAAVPPGRDELALFLLHVVFLVLTLKSRRFVEYWPVFAVMSAAAFYARYRQARGVEAASPRWERAGVALATMGLAVAAGSNLHVTRGFIKPSHDLPALRGALSYLKEHSPARSLVFTDDWDIFPACFYFNDHNVYAVGLDPEFTRTRYPALWERYRRITRAELPARLEETNAPDGGGNEITYEDIGTRFHADYVLVAADHRPLFRALTARTRLFTVVYPPEWKIGDPQPAIALLRVHAGRAP